MPVWGVVNQKGGVGKTTTAVNLAAGMAALGLRVLLIDADPQGNATTGFGVEKAQVAGTLYDVFHELVDDPEAQGALRESILDLGPGLPHLLPATLDVAGAEAVLMGAVGKEMILRDALEGIKREYDLVLIDAAPSLGLVTVNILAAADELIVPMQCEFYALEGLSHLLKTIEIVRKRINPSLKVGRVVLTMFDSRSRLSHQVAEEVEKHFPGKVAKSVIPRNVRISESPGFGQPAVVLFPDSKGAQAYMDLVQEIKPPCATSV
jgi:chromosome partitioning protein